MKEHFLTRQSHKLLSESSPPPSLSPRHTHTHTHAHKKPVLCPSEHTDVPLGTPTVWIGFFAGTECEASLLETKCCLWWELLQ